MKTRSSRKALRLALSAILLAGLLLNSPPAPPTQAAPAPAGVMAASRQIIGPNSQATRLLTIDPWVQNAKLTASDGAANDRLGYNVALSGDTALVGAIGDDNFRGSAYVFVRDDAGWSQQARLTASDGAALDNLGFGVALSGDTALVGAPFHDHFRGAAYVFVRDGTTWNQQAKLTASDAAAHDSFGYDVALSGDTALVGAYVADGYRGAAYVFVRDGAAWRQQAKLTASDGAAPDSFGYAVALDGDTALAGTPRDDGDHGSAYVFVRSGAAWNEQVKLSASDGAAFDSFGYDVALGGDTALVGAIGADDNGNNSGAAYVFLRSGAVWSEQAKLTASDGAASDRFGKSVALSDDTALVGAYADTDNGNDSGSAYVFGRSGAAWSQRAKVTASDGAAEDRFGFAVALSGDTVLVGAYGDDSQRGSVYLFGILWTIVYHPLAVIGDQAFAADRGPH